MQGHHRRSGFPFIGSTVETNVTVTKTAPGATPVTRVRSMTYTATYGDQTTEVIEPDDTTTNFKHTTTLTRHAATGVVTKRTVASGAIAGAVVGGAVGVVAGIGIATLRCGSPAFGNNANGTKT